MPFYIFLLLLLNESKLKAMRRIFLCFLFLPYVNAHFIMLLNTIYMEIFFFYFFYLFLCLSLIWGFLMLLPFPYQITHNFHNPTVPKEETNKHKTKKNIRKTKQKKTLELYVAFKKHAN